VGTSHKALECLALRDSVFTAGGERVINRIDDKTEINFFNLVCQQCIFSPLSQGLVGKV
jgi:hypothetical protein